MKTNIYYKQMRELGLTIKQYAKLIDVPYDVVKDIIYDRRGNYSMEIKNILRKTMFKKHQDVESNLDDAKFKAMQIKKEEESMDYLNWYEKEYNIEQLKQKLNIKTIKEFEQKYQINVNGKKASHWFYVVLISKKEYGGHSLQKDKKREFVKQLYDILINDNKQQYYHFVHNHQSQLTRSELTHIKSYNEWFKTFDIKKYIKDHHINNNVLCSELNLAPCTVSRLVNKVKYSDKSIIKLYNYLFPNDLPLVDNKETTNKQNDNQKIEKQQCFDDCQTDNSNVQSTTKTCDCNQKDVLRKILISRLTEEEKELITLFGGNISE